MRTSRRTSARSAAAVEVIRPAGWEAANDVPRGWTRAGHHYRGISMVEFRNIRQADVIKSDGRYSLEGEGTCFSDDAADAESYVNFGRSDPRKTRLPNYLIEVKSDALQRAADGYWKAPSVPASAITRVWCMFARGGAVVARKVRL